MNNDELSFICQWENWGSELAASLCGHKLAESGCKFKSVLSSLSSHQVLN